MQDHPGAPGTARQESTRTIVSTYDGGTATQPRAPGHERPHAALCAARHGRLSAASTAPGADIPPATAAGAPGQYCQSAAPRAPGHGRPLAIMAGVFGHDRLSAASTATAPSPAGPRRLRQVSLPRTPATPNTLTNPRTHQDITHTAYRRATRYAQSRESASPPLDSQMLEKGPGVRLSALLPPTKCILPSRFRPARGLAPPRSRASFCATTPAPRPRLPAEKPTLVSLWSPRRGGRTGPYAPEITAVRPVFSCASAPPRPIRPGPRQAAGRDPGRGADGSRTGSAAYRTGGRR